MNDQRHEKNHGAQHNTTDGTSCAHAVHRVYHIMGEFVRHENMKDEYESEEAFTSTDGLVDVIVEILDIRS